MPSMTAQFEFGLNLNHSRSSSYSSYSSSVSDSHSEPESTRTTSTTSSTNNNGSARSHNFKKVIHKRTNTYVHQISVSTHGTSASAPAPPAHSHPYIQRLLDLKPRPESESISLYYEHSNLGTINDLIRESKDHYGKIEEGFVWDLWMQLAAALVWIHSGGEGGKWGVRRRWDLRVRGGGKKENKVVSSIAGASTGVSGGSIFLHKLPSGRVIARLSRPAPTFTSNDAQSTTQSSSKTDVYELAATIKSLCTLDNATSTMIPTYYSPRLAALLKRCLSPNANDRPTAHELYIETVKGILERKCLSNGRSHTDARKVEEWMMGVVDWNSSKSSRSSSKAVKEIDPKSGKPLREKNLMEWAVEVRCDEISEMIAEVMARENEIEDERRKFTEGKEGKTRVTYGHVDSAYGGLRKELTRKIIRML